MMLVNNNNSSSSHHHRKSKKSKRHKKSHKSEKTHKKYKKSKKKHQQHHHSEESTLDTSSDVDHEPSDSENLDRKSEERSGTRERRSGGTLNARFTELARLQKEKEEEETEARGRTARITEKKSHQFKSTDPAAIVQEITKTIRTKIESKHIANQLSSSSEESVVYVLLFLITLFELKN